MCRCNINRARYSLILYFFVSLTLFLNHVRAQVACQSGCKLSTVIQQGIIGEQYVFNVNKTLDHMIEFLHPANVSSTFPARITIQSEDATVEHPLLIVLRQARGVLSWQIPLTVGNTNYSKTSRTLCPDVSRYQWSIPNSIWLNSTVEEDNSFYVNLYTGSTQNLTGRLIVEIVKDFSVSLGEEYHVGVNVSDEFTPSEPHYYQFKWPQVNDGIVPLSGGKNTSSVVVTVLSENQICMTMSIQELSCPVLDLERTVGYEGYRQTIDTKGGLTVLEDDFKKGFYIVFVVNNNDNKCNDKTFREMQSTSGPRNKTLKFIISETMGKDKYIIPIMAPLVVIGSIYILFFVAAIVYSCRPFPDSSTAPAITQSSEAIAGSSEEPSASHSTIQNAGRLKYEAPADNVSLDEIDFDTLDDALTAKQVIREKRFLKVCDLARKDTRILRRKSDMYPLNLVTVAVFYALPVFQLMLSYQATLQKTGNQDLCYYNFLCAHPLLFFNVFLSDFNHIFSNIGYVLLGLLFIIWTYRRDTMHRNSVASRPELDQLCGIPQHYGLFYALGLALIMEGILSGLYHICPNKSNFQFDTSFMYVIAVLCMVKLYQNRHPDINASAYSTFMMLASIIFVGMIGIMESSQPFFIVFSVIHVATCLWMSIQVYHLGWLTFDKNLVTITREARVELYNNPRDFFTPKYPSRMILLVVGNTLNWVWVYIGSLKLGTSNFGSYLLAVLLTNLMLYFLFYILMKLINGEKVVLEPILYFVAACAFWFSSLFFFLLRVTSWMDTPAASRHGNEGCLLLSFYDAHDIWHFLSAGGMFCTFMVLLTLDDDLIEISRTVIPVF